MAGWGDDPTLEELRRLVYDEGWVPSRIEETRADDTVWIVKGDETKQFASDHIAFHRFVEGLREDFGL
jgi:hypothetical protein